ncbi:MAG: endonuclease, partial [Muribaculaceae bacterium]|nr:endonuclease [Muribaculaceae bacterium]
VFEPDDEYKGDFARSYFYMAAAYFDKISGWSSPMLAGNNYPAFTTWAVNVLLKWHRQDPVSEKETVRNDAVYNHQHNRNPFIDHPELVEYIWGDKKDQKWDGQGGSAAGGEIVLPVDGSTIDMGVTGIGTPISTTFTVRGKDLTSAVSISATNALQLSTTTVSASQANAGYEVTATWKFSKTGSYKSTMTLACGSAKSTVTVTARVQEGLPATAATEITAESFRANWVYVGNDIDGKYILDVKQGTTSIDGYPRQVDAAAGHYTVDGLDANTAYSYTLQSATLTSNTISVTTGQLLPFIDFLYEGVLALTCEPGEPSTPDELLVDTENISGDIAISVDAPFQISTDRTNWGTALTLKPAEDRFYIRLAAE